MVDVKMVRVLLGFRCKDSLNREWGNELDVER